MSTAAAPVVVGTDGSPESDLAVDLAADAAALRGAPLHLVHAFPWISRARGWAFAPPEDSTDRAEAVLAAASRRVRERHPDLTPETESVVDDPAVVLVDRSAGAALVVVGARGQGRVAELLGSVSRKIVIYARSPALVVRAAPEHPDGPVVVGLDPDGDHPDASAHAAEEAARRGAALRVVSVLPAREDPERGAQARDERLVEARRAALESRAEELRAAHPGVEVTTRTRYGRPADALVDEAVDASVVVVGGRTPGGLVDLMLGSVSAAVVRRVPVALVVHPAGGRA